MARPDGGLGPLSTRLLAAGLLGAALLTGCTSEEPDSRVLQGESVAEPGPSCSPASAVATALPAAFPVAVPLPTGGLVTSTGQAAGFALVNGRAPGTVDDVLAHFRAALPGAGLFVGRDEDEGRAGQLTFLGGSTEGSVTVATTSCPEGSAQFTLSARRTR